MKKETSLIFTGDIGFDKYMEGKWTDENLLSDEIYAFFHSADHVVANVEGALCDIDPATDPGGKGMFCHMMNPAATVVFEKMHADIYNFANNHTMDAGSPGIHQALEIAKKLGVQTIGCGLNLEEAATPLYLEEAGGIGLIGVGYQPTCTPATETDPGNFPWDNFELIGKTIQEIKKNHRWAIVVVHGGEEFSTLPMPYIREYHQKYIELGADIVVGHHPHVPQNYELIGENKAIFYSLGNFIFDTDYQRKQINTDRGVLLKLNLTEEGFAFEGFGTQLHRGEEHITKGELPEVFTNISAENYEKMLPLAAKAFVNTEYHRRTGLSPEFKDYDAETWERYFNGEFAAQKKRPGFRKYEVVKALAAQADKKTYEGIGLDEVVTYLNREFEER